MSTLTNTSSLCLSEPCFSGTCLDEVDKFTCLCSNETTGLFCEIPNIVEEIKIHGGFQGQFYPNAQSLVLCVIVTVLQVFITFFIILRFHDNEDHIHWQISPAADNSPQHKGHYEVHIHTGSPRDAWTDAAVGLNMTGSKGETGIRTLTTYKKLVFEYDSIRSFYLTTPEKLGDLQMVGVHAERTIINKEVKRWFLNLIIVVDLETLKWYPFIFRRWVLIELDESSPVRKDYNLTELSQTNPGCPFRQNFVGVLFEYHFIFSAFIRRAKSYFTRVQRLCCSMFVWSAILLINAVWVQFTFNKNKAMFKVGQLEIPYVFYYFVPISMILVTAMGESVAYLFYKSRLSSECASQNYISSAPLLQIKNYLIFPNYSINIAHGIVALTSTLSFAVCCHFSFYWTRAMSDVWIFAISISIIADFFIIQMMKVLILALLKTYFWKQDIDLDLYRRLFPEKTIEEASQVELIGESHA